MADLLREDEQHLLGDKSQPRPGQLGRKTAREGLGQEGVRPENSSRRSWVLGPTLDRHTPASEA